MEEKTKRIANTNDLSLNQLVTLNDLIDFKAELLVEIRNLLSLKNSTATKKWLKSNEVRKLLSISAGSLQNLRIKGTLPFTKIGGAFYYSSDDIDRMLANGQNKNLIQKFSL